MKKVKSSRIENFHVLPDDVLGEIFSFELPNKLYGIINLVCKRLKKLVESKEFVAMVSKQISEKYDYSDIIVTNELKVFKKCYKELVDKKESFNKRTPHRYILRHAKKFYPKQNNPMSYSALIKYFMGGPDPINYIYFFRCEDKKGPYWHYISCGMSQVFDDAPNDTAFPFEFSLRLYDDSAVGQRPMAPRWVASVMQNLARYCFKSGNGFDEGHYVPTNSPICMDEETELCAFVFRKDVQLKSINTFNYGEIKFLEMLPLTKEELKGAEMWSVLGITQMVYPGNNPVVIDLKRKNIMTKENLKIVQSKVLLEGSNCGILSYEDTNCTINITPKKIRIAIWEQFYESFSIVLKSRIKFGRDFILNHESTPVVFFPCPFKGNERLLPVNEPKIEEIQDEQRKFYRVYLPKEAVEKIDVVKDKSVWVIDVGGKFTLELEVIHGKEIPHIYE